MPGKVKVQIVAGRNLPIMDRSSELTDAFVEVKFGSTTYKTEVYRKSLNPQWNSEWFRFEVDDEDLQDEPLQIRVLDHDTYSAHDAIGKVYIDLDPLLSKGNAHVISGWFPIYDTMHGIRGELNVTVKVDLFTDFNKFRQSSCGVQFFCTSGVPHGFRIQSLKGFVEELVVNDDPEHQWIDKIRSMRASNEARQLQFSKLTGELQRKIGLKVLEMGGNAVIGYRQCFDLEGESGIVVRAVGTSVALTKHWAIQPFSASPHCDSASPSRDGATNTQNSPTSAPPILMSNQPNPRPRLVSCPQIFVIRENHEKCLEKEHFENTVTMSSSKKSPKTNSNQEKLKSQEQNDTVLNESLSFASTNKSVISKQKTATQCKNQKQTTQTENLLVNKNQTSKTLSISNKSETKMSPKPSKNQEANETTISIKTQTSSGTGSRTKMTTSQSSGNLKVNRLSFPGLHSAPSRSPGVDFSAPLEEGSSSGGTHSPGAVMMVTPVKTGGTSPLKVESAGNMTTGSGGGANTSRIRRSSDSDISTPPKGGGSLTGSSGSAGGSATKAMLKPQNIDLMEYPFFPMRNFPPGFIVHLGGVVSARSVKLLDRIHNPDEPETRDAWWTELRTEIRSHARSMACHAVIGYYESTAICDEIIILSACGTAAVVNLDMCGHSSVNALVPLSVDRQSVEREISLDKSINKEGKTTGITPVPGGAVPGSVSHIEKEMCRKLHVDINLANDVNAQRAYRVSESDDVPYSCHMCHIPYNESSLPFPVNLSKCALCRGKNVPDVLFTTVEPPSEMPVIGKGCFIQARICRNKKELKGESHAKEISDSLPFMEYELHSQLIHKLRIKGMNMLFGLRITFCVGDKLLVAVATATGVFSACLPVPQPPKLVGIGESSSSGSSLTELQKKVSDEINKNIDRYNLYIPEFLQGQPSPPSVTSLSEDMMEEDSGGGGGGSGGGIGGAGGTGASGSGLVVGGGTDIDLGIGNKDTFLLEIDDAEDADVVSVLLDPAPPPGFEICNTEVMPGVPNVVCNLQTFTKVWRGQLSLTNNKSFSNVFNYLLKGLYFKLRKMSPCALCHLDFDIDLPEDDEIQISITGTCAGLGDPQLTLQQPGLVTMAIQPPGTDQGLRADQAKLGPSAEDMMFDMEMATDTGGAPTHNVTQGGTGGAPTHNVTQGGTQTRYVTPQGGAPSQNVAPGTGVPSHNVGQEGGTTTPSQTDSPSLLTHNLRTPSRNSTDTSLNKLQERTKTAHIRHSPVLCKGLASMKEDRKIKYHTSPKHKPGVELTPLAYIPGGKIEKYLGHLNFFIVRETTSLNSMGGLNGFLHSFIAEVMAICRAHVGALGGNALVSYQMSECVLEDNIQKNQSQCLVNVYGDVVQVLYDTELQPVPDRMSHHNPVISTTETRPYHGPVVTNSPILKIKTATKSSPKHARTSNVL